MKEKKNNVYFIRPKKEYKDITSEKFYEEKYNYPINPIEKNNEIVGFNNKDYNIIVDDMDKFKMSNNYYTY